jgi:hypothetical protein
MKGTVSRDLPTTIMHFRKKILIFQKERSFCIDHGTYGPFKGAVSRNLPTSILHSRKKIPVLPAALTTEPGRIKGTVSRNFSAKYSVFKGKDKYLGRQSVASVLTT